MTHYSKSWDIQGWIIISWDFSQFEICGSHVERCVPLQSTCTNPKLCTCGSHAEHCVPLPFLPVSCVGSLSLVFHLRMGKSAIWSPAFYTLDDNITDIFGSEYELFQSSIPSLIGSLTQLRVFSVLLNSLGGTIPSSLCSIILDISSLRCQFIDWFSSFLCRLALATIVLTLLALGTNSFISSIPSSMGSLSRLSYLQMSFNRLTGTVPPTVGCLTRLTWIGGANHASNWLIQRNNESTPVKNFEHSPSEENCMTREVLDCSWMSKAFMSTYPPHLASTLCPSVPLPPVLSPPSYPSSLLLLSPFCSLTSPLCLSLSPRSYCSLLCLSLSPPLFTHWLTQTSHFFND
jgi:hypothetical protein